ncbi:MAG: protein phosphatase 2C domain-containing protein [Armatimonadetes bacterium]|nr:protein phosphatase 2C domain-containing protein [Armatimonadota bacterium]
MDESPWRYAFRSVAGTAHIKSRTVCQDSSLCHSLTDVDGNEVLIGVVSDGAGTAVCSAKGAEMACDHFFAVLYEYFARGYKATEIDREYIVKWISGYQEIILREARSANRTVKDYACTLLAVVAGSDTTVFCQVGDGAIVVSTGETRSEYAVIFWPQQGEYASTTNFLTDLNASDYLDFQTMGAVQDVAIFTDGLERLSLVHNTKSPFAAFFQPLFDALRNAAPFDADKTSQLLEQFLSSERVNERTDDDKTLILASRCASPPDET